MRYAPLIFFLFAAFEIMAQASRKFYNSEGSEVDSSKSYYYVIATPDSSSGLRKNAFYTASNRIRLEEGDLKEGKIQTKTLYYENGKKHADGIYKSGVPAGTFTAYYEDGSRQSELVFVDVRTRKPNDPELKIINYWGPDGKQIVVNGNGVCDCNLNPFANGVVMEKGTVLNGWKDDRWEGFSKTGNYNYSELYNQGVLVNGTLHSKGETFQYESLITMAQPATGMGAFYRFIGTVIGYPKEARKKKTEGKVFVEFVVDKDGSLSNIRAVRGIGDGCDEEAVRVVSLSPKWNPGTQRGRAVKSRYTLPITFKLQ